MYAIVSGGSFVSLGGAAVLTLALCGCGAGGAAPLNVGAVNAAAVSVAVVDGAGYRKVIEKHRGRVVLVDFWATWCAPCKKLFPHVVELGRTHAIDGLVIVSVSMDEPEKKGDVLAFLEKEGASFDNLVSEFGAGTKSADELELRGDVPFYKLYDRAGKLRWQLSADPDGLELGDSIEHVDERVSALLSEK
jgi:cytochrome c biogenesis protein CcmG/thiol:disulfide interchange protein DsbE